MRWALCGQVVWGATLDLVQQFNRITERVSLFSPLTLHFIPLHVEIKSNS